MKPQLSNSVTVSRMRSVFFPLIIGVLSFVLAQAVRAQELELLEKVSSSDWELPEIQRGKFLLRGEKVWIEISYKGASLEIWTSEKNLLFHYENFIVGGVRRSEEAIVCDLFLHRNKGYNFFGFLVVFQTKFGVASYVSHASPNFADRQSKDFTYYFLEIGENMRFPEQEVIVNLLRPGADEMETWKAKVLLGPLRMNK